jgi:hypothetical protein
VFNVRTADNYSDDNQAVSATEVLKTRKKSNTEEEASEMVL